MSVLRMQPVYMMMMMMMIIVSPNVLPSNPRSLAGKRKPVGNFCRGITLFLLFHARIDRQTFYRHQQVGRFSASFCKWMFTKSPPATAKCDQQLRLFTSNWLLIHLQQILPFHFSFPFFHYKNKGTTRSHDCVPIVDTKELEMISAVKCDLWCRMKYRLARLAS